MKIPGILFYCGSCGNFCKTSFNLWPEHDKLRESRLDRDPNWIAFHPQN